MTYPLLLPPIAGDLAQTDLWEDPHGCINQNPDSDCPICPPIQSGCALQRTFQPPPGAPLVTSISDDNSKVKGQVWGVGIQYSDCTEISHRAGSGAGCRGTSDPKTGAPIPCTNCGEYGQSVAVTFTRIFTHQIDTLQVLLLSEDADDVGYVGGMKVSNCCNALVTFPFDITSQVTSGGNIAVVTCRAADVACGDNYFNMNLQWRFKLKN